MKEWGTYKYLSIDENTTYARPINKTELQWNIVTE